MKTVIIALATTTLLSLAACAKPDDGAANVIVEDAGNVDVLGNDSTFASDNVLLPQVNATNLTATDSNAAQPMTVTGNTV